MTNFPSKKKSVTVGDKEVVLRDLSVGFLVDIESGAIEDSLLNVLKDSSNLGEDEIKGLRKSEAEFLVEEVIKLTYGEKIEEDEGSIEKK